MKMKVVTTILTVPWSGLGRRQKEQFVPAKKPHKLFKNERNFPHGLNTYMLLVRYLNVLFKDGHKKVN